VRRARRRSQVQHVRWREEEAMFEVEVEGRFLQKCPADYEGHAALEINENFEQKVWKGPQHSGKRRV